MPVGCIDHLPSCVYVWRVHTGARIVALVSLVIGVSMIELVMGLGFLQTLILTILIIWQEFDQ